MEEQLAWLTVVRLSESPALIFTVTSTIPAGTQQPGQKLHNSRAAVLREKCFAVSFIGANSTLSSWSRWVNQINHQTITSISNMNTQTTWHLKHCYRVKRWRINSCASYLLNFLFDDLVLRFNSTWINLNHFFNGAKEREMTITCNLIGFFKKDGIEWKKFVESNLLKQRKFAFLIRTVSRWEIAVSRDTQNG